MPRSTPERVVAVQHDYENTDKTIGQIARDHSLNERTVRRWSLRNGWLRSSERPREMSPAMDALHQATRLLAARRAPPDPAPALDMPIPSGRDGEGFNETAAIERIARLVERELAAEEAMRAQLGALPRLPGDAERCARTLSTLTQTLHALQRLRCGLTPDMGAQADDAMPADIDEFRLDLARRIDAFVASRRDAGDAGGDRPGAVDAAR